MLSILVQSREAAPRLNRARLRRAQRVVPSTFGATPQEERLPQLAVGLANAAEASPRISTGTPVSIGSLLYLSSVGLIAAGIVAVFFGAGFSLLVPTARGTISGSANRAGPEAMSPLPSLGGGEQQTYSIRPLARGNKDGALNFAAFPAPTEAPAIDGKDDVPHLDGVLASKASPDMPAASANAPVPELTSPTAIAHAPPTSGFSGAEMAELLEHGDTLLRNGDVASARLFYERAANAGDGRAALRLGATFDPEFLGRLGLGKLQANPAEARSWYSRARDLGAVDAKAQPNSLETRQRK
jgi:hypothetical protein